jgi:LPXTG-motif cell wall-anchored protein
MPDIAGRNGSHAPYALSYQIGRGTIRINLLFVLSLYVMLWLVLGFMRKLSGEGSARTCVRLPVFPRSSLASDSETTMTGRWTHPSKRARLLGSLAAVAAVASVWGVGVSPAGAAGSHPGGVGEMCPEVLQGSPTGGLEKVTDPPDGSEVYRGDVIKVTLTWDKARFDGPTLHKALDCVTTDGKLAPDLSVQERDPANDGVFEHSFTVPDGLPDGTRLCDRGFVSGPGSEEGFDRAKSNDVCFKLGGKAPASEAAPPPAGPSPAPGSPAPPSPAPPAPAPGSPAPPSPTPPSPAPPSPAPPSPGQQPPEVAPISGGPSGGPAPRLSGQAPPGAGQIGPGAGSQAAPTLPATGSGSGSLALVAAGALLSGALSAAAGRQRPAAPISRA